MSLAGICRMITDIQKYNNDNLFSDQVLVLLVFSNERKCEVVMKIVVFLISIFFQIRYIGRRNGISPNTR